MPGQRSFPAMAKVHQASNKQQAQERTLLIGAANLHPANCRCCRQVAPPSPCTLISANEGALRAR